MDILENSDNLWEDITFSNMANILKIYFSNDKSNLNFFNIIGNLQEVKENKDMEKWKKYFVTLFERVSKNFGLQISN